MTGSRIPPAELPAGWCHAVVLKDGSIAGITEGGLVTSIPPTPARPSSADCFILTRLPTRREMKRLIRLGVWPLMKHTRAFDYRVDRIRLKSAFGPTERLIPEEYGIRTVEEPPPSWFWGVGGWTYVSRHKSLRRALAALAAHGPARILSAERPMTEKDAQPIPTT